MGEDGGDDSGDDDFDDMNNTWFVAPDETLVTMTIPSWFPAPQCRLTDDLKSKLLTVYISNYIYLTYDQSVFVYRAFIRSSHRKSLSLRSSGHYSSDRNSIPVFSFIPFPPPWFSGQLDFRIDGRQILPSPIVFEEACIPRKRQFRSRTTTVIVKLQGVISAFAKLEHEFALSALAYLVANFSRFAHLFTDTRVDSEQTPQPAPQTTALQISSPSGNNTVTPLAPSHQTSGNIGQQIPSPIQLAQSSLSAGLHGQGSSYGRHAVRSPTTGRQLGLEGRPTPPPPRSSLPTPSTNATVRSNNTTTGHRIKAVSASLDDVQRDGSAADAHSDDDDFQTPWSALSLNIQQSCHTFRLPLHMKCRANTVRSRNKRKKNSASDATNNHNPLPMDDFSFLRDDPPPFRPPPIPPIPPMPEDYDELEFVGSVIPQAPIQSQPRPQL